MRIAGRTKTSKDTSALTGLPGSPKNGTRPRPSVPKPCGMPGCIATRSKSHGAEFGQRLLDHVVRPGADPAAGDEDVGPQQLALEHVEQPALVVGHDPDPVDVGSGVACGGGQRVAVDVDDLAELGRLADVDQLAIRSR